LLGVRNLYKVFSETRKAAREQATLAVTGDSARAAEVAALLGAQRGARGAHVILAVSETGATISGKAVEDSGEIPLPASGGSSSLDELAHRIARALDEDYLVPLAKGYPPLRRAACEEIIRHNARQNAVVGALPIPGADMPVMTANQARMVLKLAAAYGEELSMERARELIGVLAAGFGLRALSRQVVKLVPRGRMGGRRRHRLRRYRGDGPLHHAVLRTRRTEGGRRGDGGDQGPRRRRGEGLRLPPATPVAPTGRLYNRGMFSLLRQVSSETRSGFSALRAFGLRVFLALTAVQAVIVGVLVAMAEFRKRRGERSEGFPWEDQPEIELSQARTG
jgi:hypothetical protein